MRIAGPLLRGRLQARRKRFLADVELDHGEVVVAHCPDPGRMLGLAEPGAEVLLSRRNHPRRKLAYTWELVRSGRSWVDINTLRANAVVEEALLEGRVAELAGFESLQREVVVGQRRLDFALDWRDHRCFVEVKSVTLARGSDAYFPDAVSERSAAHVRELQRLAAAGHRSVLLFLVKRNDCCQVRLAEDIDPRYAEVLLKARGAVEVLAYRARVTSRSVSLELRLPFDP